VSYPFPWKFEGYRYSDLYLMRQIDEAQVQREIVTLLEAFDIDAVPIDAGGRRARGRMMAAAKSAGIELGSIAHAKTGHAIPAGFSDLIATLAPSGRGIFIEVKAPAWIGTDKKIIRRAGAPSQEQLDFLLSKHDRGALVLVAWSSLDVEEYLGKEALALNRKAVRR